MFCLYNVGRQQTSMSRNDIVILVSSDATALACLVDEENAVEA